MTPETYTFTLSRDQVMIVLAGMVALVAARGSDMLQPAADIQRTIEAQTATQLKTTPEETPA